MYVNPYLTSKKSPNCGKINNVKGRGFICKCGFQKHRDIVGAMNISVATEVDFWTALNTIRTVKGLVEAYLRKLMNKSLGAWTLCCLGTDERKFI